MGLFLTVALIMTEMCESVLNPHMSDPVQTDVSTPPTHRHNKAGTSEQNFPDQMAKGERRFIPLQHMDRILTGKTVYNLNNMI